MTRYEITPERQMFVLNRASYVSCIGKDKKPLTIGKALRLLNKLNMQKLERELA